MTFTSKVLLSAKLDTLVQQAGHFTKNGWAALNVILQVAEESQAKFYGTAGSFFVKIFFATKTKTK